MWKNIRYVAVAVDDINEGIKLYEDLFDLKQMTPIRDETRYGYRNVRMGDGEKMLLELLTPINPDSALARFMKERAGPQNPHGEGLYVIGVEVDDLDGRVKHIRDRGGKVAQELPDMAWVHPLTTNHTFFELHRHREQ